MTMRAKITKPIAAVTLDDAVGAYRQPNVAMSASARRTLSASVAHNSPSLVIVVPDPVDAIVGVGSEAGLKGGSKLLWTLGVLLLLAL
jgi:hypothetical protein